MITANPKTAGVARWNFLALWGHLMDQGDEAAQRFVTRVHPVTVISRAPVELPSSMMIQTTASACTAAQAMPGN